MTLLSELYPYKAHLIVGVLETLAIKECLFEQTVSGKLLSVSSSTGSLIDKKGKILIPGMYKDVAPLTDEEKKLYEKIDFDMDEYCKDVGVEQLLHDTKARILNLLLTRLKQVEMCCTTPGRCIVK